MRHPSGPLFVIALVLIWISTGCQAEERPDKDLSPDTGSTSVAEEPEDTTQSDATSSSPDDATACDTSEKVVHFTTSDGVRLAADYRAAEAAGRPAVVLLHMIPPSNDRSGYPARIREAIHDLGVNVLNVDRRGAGDSEGEPKNAYEGATARLDVEAAAAFLIDDERDCPAARDEIVLVGASNGTTSVLDYTVARSDSSLPDPAALIWLSPGSYTENQNVLDQHTETLNSLFILFVYPDSEPWSEDQRGPETWKFVEIGGGSHGTRNFDGGELESEALPEITQWITDHTSAGE